MGSAEAVIAPVAILMLALTGPGEINYDRALDAIAQQETGNRFIGGQVIYFRHVRNGTAASAFQITRAVSNDLRASWCRIQTDSRYASICAARWLAHLVQVTGSLRQAFAAYRLGLGHRDWPEAQAYAARAMNLYLNNQGNK